MKNNNYSSKFSLFLYNIFQRFPIFRNFKIIFYFIDGIILLFIKKPKVENNRKRKKIFIIYNYAFGDGVIWLTAGKQLRHIYPKKNYEISIICQKGIHSLYENQNIFDKVIPYDLTRSTFNLKLRFKLFKLLRNNYYDIILDPIGPIECTMNVFMSRVLVSKEKKTILDVRMNSMCPKWIIKNIYTEVYHSNIKNISLIDFYAEFIRQLGYKNYETSLIPLQKSKLSFKLPKKYFVIFPSASTNMKKWPIERYAELTNKIYNELKIPLLLCGTDSDKNDIEKFEKLLNFDNVLDIVGKTSLLEFIETLRKASLIVTNDTSTYHIGVIHEVPTVIITGGYTYNKYVTYNFVNSDKYLKPCIITSKNIKCFNCDNKCIKLTNNDKIWPCLNEISLEETWKTVKKYIKECVL